VTCKTHYPKGYVWRTKGTRLDPKNVNVQNIEKGFMIWGCITINGGNLIRIRETVKASTYIQILAEGLPDNEEFILLHDNATSHTANDTKDWLDRNKIIYLRIFHLIVSI